MGTIKHKTSGNVWTVHMIPEWVSNYYDDICTYYRKHGGLKIIQWILPVQDKETGRWQMTLKDGVPEDVYQLALELADGLEAYLREMYYE